MKVVRRPFVFDAVENEAGEWVVTHPSGVRDYLLPDVFAKLYEPFEPKGWQQIDQINKLLEAGKEKKNG